MIMTTMLVVMMHDGVCDNYNIGYDDDDNVDTIHIRCYCCVLVILV